MNANRSLPMIQIDPLPQYVPSGACLACDVCCRFPEADSFLRPYFREEEIAQAVTHGIDPRHFPDPRGTRIDLVPNPSGTGYLCPAFDPATTRCRVYGVRPLDCQIYPLALMWSANGQDVLLGWDRKCPFVAERGAGSQGHEQSMVGYAARVADLLERDETIDALGRHPDLIGRYQEDVVVLRPLPRVTRRLRPDAPALRSLGSDDYSTFEAALRMTDAPLAAFALAPHVMWRALFRYFWAELAGRFCLFAAYSDGWFMPLPPIGSGSLKEAVRAAFGIMRGRNRGSLVSRIENVPEGWKPLFEDWGYRVTAKDPDYLYDASALVELRGDRYKSQRAACNRFLREHEPRYEPYGDAHREPCRALLRRWLRQKEAAGMDGAARVMLQDAVEAHEILFREWTALGLTGRVVSVQESLVAYTFGYLLQPQTYGVLVEVTDRSIPGLAAYVFREHCREALAFGAQFINTMDDSGLTGLRRAKEAYHPIRHVTSYIVSDPS